MITSDPPTLARFHSVADEIPAQLLGLLAGFYVSGVLALYAGLRIGFGTALLGLCAGLLLPRFLGPSRTGPWSRLLLPATVLLAALLVSNAFFDGSSDTIGYHKPGVLQLLDGWNPYRNASAGPGLSYWTVVYPKASWICGAQLTSLTGRLECSKAVNLLALVATGCVAWRFFRPRLPQYPRIAVLASILIAINPVTLVQCTTFYVDGLLASLLTILLLDLAGFVAGERSRAGWFEITVCTVLLTNLKFTGLVYAGLAWFFAGLLSWRFQGFGPARRFAGVGMLVLLPAMLLFGKTPYLDNLSAGHHLFHPLMGTGKIPDFMTTFRPAQIAERDRFTRFLIVNLAKEPKEEADILAPRWPFQFRPFSVRLPDAKISAFGPFYGEAVLLALLTLIFFVVGRHPPFHLAGSFLLIAVLATGFCHEDAWWARYSPQLFLLTPLAAVIALRSENRSLNRLGAMLLAVLALNVTVVAFNALGRSAWVTFRLNQDIAAMRSAGNGGRPIEVNFGHFHPLSRRLQEAGVHFVETPGTDTAGWHPVYSTLTCFWRNKPTDPQP